MPPLCNLKSKIQPVKYVENVKNVENFENFENLKYVKHIEHANSQTNAYNLPSSVNSGFQNQNTNVTHNLNNKRKSNSLTYPTKDFKFVSPIVQNTFVSQDQHNMLNSTQNVFSNLNQSNVNNNKNVLLNVNENIQKSNVPFNLNSLQNFSQNMLEILPINVFQNVSQIQNNNLSYSMLPLSIVQNKNSSFQNLNQKSSKDNSNCHLIAKKEIH